MTGAEMYIQSEISQILYSEFSLLDCRFCRFYKRSPKLEDRYDFCKECNKKDINWSIDLSYCDYIAKEILAKLKEKEYKIKLYNDCDGK